MPSQPPPRDEPWRHVLPARADYTMTSDSLTSKERTPPMTTVPALPWYTTISREQWKTLLAAMLGWMLDAMDFVLYLTALNPLRSQLGFDTDMAGILASV